VDFVPGLEVSPGEKTIVDTKAANRGLHKRLSVGADLKLIEHFRLAIGDLLRRCGEPLLDAGPFTVDSGVSRRGRARRVAVARERWTPPW
jgi:hypothetical protein